MALRPHKRRKLTPPLGAQNNVTNQQNKPNVNGASHANGFLESHMQSASAAEEDEQVDSVNGEDGYDATNAFVGQEEENELDGSEEGDDDLEEDGSGDDMEDDSNRVNRTRTQTQPTRARRNLHTLRTTSGQISATGSSRLSLLKLETQELLKEISSSYGPVDAPAEDMLKKLKVVIENIPDVAPLPVKEAEKRILKTYRIVLPYPPQRPPATAQYKFAFARPSSINVTGSYVLKTAIRTDGRLTMDLVVTIPDELLDDKDYLDYRYFHKRAYYLATIAGALQQTSEINAKISFSCLCDNPLLPIILVQPHDNDVETGFAKSCCDIAIIPAISSSKFPVDKLLPAQSRVRSQVTAASGNLGPHSAPTPFYNSSLRAECSVLSYLNLMHKASKLCQAYRDACILGRVWLRQRGLSASIQAGGFGGFEWDALLALLLHTGGPNRKPYLLPTLDAYDLFRSTLNYLKDDDRDLSKKPVILTMPDEVLRSLTDLGDLDDGPMLFDSSRGVNLFYKMTPWSYNILRSEATSSADARTNASAPFDAIFIQRLAEPMMRYDLIARIELAPQVANVGFAERALPKAEQLYKVLAGALKNRVTMMNIACARQDSWSIKTAQPQQGVMQFICSFAFNTGPSSSRIQHGPQVDNASAVLDFDAFWGDKAESRRFSSRDNQVCRCVYWDAKDDVGFATMGDSISITKQIIMYILPHHFNNSAVKDIKFFGNDFNNIPGLLGSSARLSSTSLQENNKHKTLPEVLKIIDKLTAQIRSLEGLPLPIRDIHAAVSGLAYTFVPNSAPLLQQRQQPLDIAMQFESSGRWPDDLCAIQMTKIAFLIKLKQLLTEQGNRRNDAIFPSSSRIGLENESQVILNKGFLDIGYISKIGKMTFRIRIYHDRETTLIDRRLNDKTLLGAERDEAVVALAEYQRNFVQKPLQAQAIQSLANAGKYIAFATTLRVVNAWFASHLLVSHFPPEVIELIVAHIFVQPHPWDIPASAMTGLTRTLLFLANWDWRFEPLVVDLKLKSENDNTPGLSVADHQTINERFTAWRKIDPGFARVTIFTATNFDKDGTTWTDRRPALVVVDRICELARAACKAIRGKGIKLELSSLYKSPLRAFDFILQMSERFAGPDGWAMKQSGINSEQSKYKNLQAQLQPNQNDTLVGYAPMQLFFDELQRLYGDAILFFHNFDSGTGGNAVIAGLWSPQTAQRPWKVNLPFSSIPVDAASSPQNRHQNGEGQMTKDYDATLNKEAILAEIATLGGDLVKNIEMMSK